MAISTFALSHYVKTKMMLRINKKYLNPCNTENLVTYKRNLSENSSENKAPCSTLERVRKDIDVDKKALQWRKPIEEPYVSKLKLFGNEEQTSDFITMMQKPFDPSTWYSKWQQRKEDKERFMQQFLVERHNTLGPDLAAAHFTLFRGGSVKLLHNPKWITADKEKTFELPDRYNSNFKLEALKCDGMLLYYEGLANLRWLQYLKLLSLHNVRTFDDWCLDRVSGSQYPQLETLDISGTNCTYLGLSCLYRLNTLKLLIMDDPKESLQSELVCSMLSEALPKLEIVSGNSMHNDTIKR